MQNRGRKELRNATFAIFGTESLINRRVFATDFWAIFHIVAFSPQGCFGVAFRNFPADLMASEMYIRGFFPSYCPDIFGVSFRHKMQMGSFGNEAAICFLLNRFTGISEDKMAANGRKWLFRIFQRT